MITKNDWDSALDAWVIAERERLGGPPTAEEVAAYVSGALPDAEAERVRALLVYYPELTSLLAEAVPPKRAGVVLRLVRSIAAARVAASLLLAGLGALLVQSRLQIARMERATRAPYIYASRHELRATPTRGEPRGEVYDLPADESVYLLDIPVPDEPRHPEYRIDLVDVSTERPKIVRTMTAPPPERGPLALSVPREVVPPGTYRIDLYGLQNGQPERLSSVRIRTRAP